MKPIFFISEARTEIEAKHNSSLVSHAGVELFRMLGEADVIKFSSFDRDYISKFYTTSDPAYLESIWGLHSEIYRTSVFNLHPEKNDIEFFCGPKAEGIPGYGPLVKAKYVRQEFEPQLDRLAQEIMRVDPNLIICLGNTALWALSGRTGISKLRGTTLLSSHTVSGFKCLATYHPSAITKQWELRPTIIADLMKAKRESTYAEIRRPHRSIWIDPSLDDIRQFIETYVIGCDLLSVDIETSGTRITCIGFAPSESIAIVIPFDDGRSANGNYWQTKSLESECWGIIRGVLADASIPKLFQNGAYDIGFLWRAYGIKTLGAREDTMLLQHALHPEALKGLGYLGSIYSDEGSWKHMRRKDETIKRDA